MNHSITSHTVINATVTKTLLATSLLAISSTSMADVPAIHGMVLFGGKNTYASHLPMFHAPHNYQAVFEIAIEELPQGTGAAQQYHETKKSNADALFTLVPEKLDLTKVISGEKTSFQADIFEGHFEKGGVDLGPVQVTVSKVVFSQTLEQNSSANTQFVVFGKEGEFFATKKIGGFGSYDAIMKVGVPEKLFWYSCPSRACGMSFEKQLSDADFPLEISSNMDWSFHAPLVGDTIENWSGPTVHGTSPSWTQHRAKVSSIIYSSSDDLGH